MRRIARLRLAVPARRSSSAAAVWWKKGDPGAALVVGGARGIGAAVARKLSAQGGFSRVLVTSRQGGGGALRMDVEEEESVRECARGLETELNGGGLRLVVVCAGLLHDDASGHGPERSIARLDPDWFLRSVRVNALGPLLVAKHFSPLLDRRGVDGMSAVAALSARVGSIGDNRLGGWCSYRASKAALNQGFKTASLELRRRGVVAVLLHPGTVATDLSAPFQRNVRPDKLFSADVSAAHLVSVLGSLGEADAGAFFAWDGTKIPW